MSWFCGKNFSFLRNWIQALELSQYVRNPNCALFYGPSAQETQ